MLICLFYTLIINRKPTEKREEKIMKKIMAAVVIAAVLASTPCTTAFASDYGTEKEDVILTDLDYFSKDSWVEIVSNEEDSYGGHYGSVIYAGQGSMDSNVKGLSYYLGGEYSEFSVTLFIPKAANQTSTGHSYQWDIADFAIYAANESGDEKKLFSKSDFTSMMKPLEITLDLSDAEFLRFEWRNCFYYDTGSAEPLFMLGDPILSPET